MKSMADAPADPPRYSERPFPAYRYLPGRKPHPTRHPDGHSHGAEETRVDSFDPRDWKACEAYRYGVDLFNHGYWWEAHEALEPLWIAGGRDSDAGLFIQGLIQIAAAAIKRAVDARTPAASLAALGVAKLRRQSGVYLGIDVAAFSAEVERYVEGESERPPRIYLVGL